MGTRKRRGGGIIPRILRWIGTLFVWAFHHPQPAILCAVFLATSLALLSYGSRADAFRIAHIQLPAQSNLTLKESIIGENIFTLDIRTLAAELKRQQPALKEVRVVRELPNTLRIEAIERVPIAQLLIERWYPIDGEGFIIPAPSEIPEEGLTRVVGTERSKVSALIGTGGDDKRLMLALRVLRMLKQSTALRLHKLIELNVSDAKRIRFLIDGGTEVRCGSEEELETQIERLRSVLNAMAKQHIDVSYIDVAFPEPVIGPRT